MNDNSGRIAWVWGPLLLLALLVVVFQFAEVGGAGPGAGEPRGTPSNALSANPSPGAAVGAPSRDGEARLPGEGFAPHPGYPAVPYAAGPVPYPGMPGCPPWGWPHSYPRPGDHAGRYWGGGAAEWGPPIGEYGPDAKVDPYWWVAAAEEDDR